MSQTVKITRQKFLDDKQGRTFTDVANDSRLPFDDVLEFFSSSERQRRMEEAEWHHDRAALAGVVRELEALPTVQKFLAAKHPRSSQRFRQSIGVLVRMIMEIRGWQKTGRKGSLGVRSTTSPGSPSHNTGGLAFWFIRAERYRHEQGVKFMTVQERCRQLESPGTTEPTNGKDSKTRRVQPKRLS